KVLTGVFELEGQRYMALDGGPQFKFTEAISLFVDCNGQEEVDTLWAKLTEGGKEVQCGWLKDKYGVSWQIIPRRLMELMQDKDPAKAKRVMEAMMKMIKIDVAELERAYNGK
ncbi:MAG: VOC family protein, partial [Candidatus Hydrogenedentota bacterium]